MVEIFLALLCAFIFRLIYERAERISVWIVRIGCQLLPTHVRNDTLERVEADLQHVEGPAWKLISAVGFWRMVIPKYLARAVLATTNPPMTGKEILAIANSAKVGRAIVTASTSSGLIRRKSKTGYCYAFLPVEDKEGVFEVVLFSEVLWEHGEYIRPNCRVRMLVETSGYLSPWDHCLMVPRVLSVLSVLSVEEVEDEK